MGRTVCRARGRRCTVRESATEHRASSAGYPASHHQRTFGEPDRSHLLRRWMYVVCAPPPPSPPRRGRGLGWWEVRTSRANVGQTDTEEEKGKFFDDAMSLATEMTSGQTFADHLPLMNYWAGFSASKEVGLSTPSRSGSGLTPDRQ